MDSKWLGYTKDGQPRTDCLQDPAAERFPLHVTRSNYGSAGRVCRDSRLENYKPRSQVSGRALIPLQAITESPPTPSSRQSE